MFFSFSNKLSPRTNSRRVEGLESFAQIQLEDRQMLAAVNVGDTFIRDANPADSFTITKIESNGKIEGNVVFNGVTEDFHAVTKKNGTIVVRIASSGIKGKFSVTEVPESSPVQLNVSGSVTVKQLNLPKTNVSGTFTLQVT